MTQAEKIVVSVLKIITYKKTTTNYEGLKNQFMEVLLVIGGHSVCCYNLKKNHQGG